MVQKSRSLFDHPAAFLELAIAMREGGSARKAVKLAKAALLERPDDAELAAVARAIFSRGVNVYHRAMLADTPRNAAYRRAIDRFAGGKTVLDIGTGSGLLAMMAVRAGAKHVYACDHNPTKADLARDIIRANGMADRITVIDKLSLDLDREVDLGGGVDMVVSELFSANVVGETLMEALAQGEGHPEVSEVEGFDLSLLDQRLSRDRALKVSPAGAVQRGPGASLYDCVFQPDTPAPLRGRQVTELVSQGGTVNGVVQWLRIEFADDIVYENAPGSDPLHHWDVRFEPFATERETEPGERIDVGCIQAGGSLVIWEADRAS